MKSVAKLESVRVTVGVKQKDGLYEMTVTKKGLVEEVQSFSRFIQRNYDRWLKFCEEERDGKQSIENLLMLTKSLTGKERVEAHVEPPWRFLISSYQLKEMAKNVEGIAITLKEIKEWEEHEA